MQRYLLIGLVLLLSLCNVAYPQPEADDSPQTIEVRSSSQVRSQIIHLEEREGLSVTGESTDPSFSVDLYVYNKDKTLVGMDDQDLSSPVFNWSAPEAGDYYIVCINPTSGSGSITVTAERTKSLSVPGTPTYAQVQVFYATDRIATGATLPDSHFGTELDQSDRLHLGSCTVSIPRDHRMGELEGPSIFRLEFREDPAKDVVLQSVKEENESTFYRDVADRIQHSPSKRILVFIHGFNTSFNDAMRRTAQIAYDVGFEGPAIAYSWPSQAEANVEAYNKDSRNSALTAIHLKSFLESLARRSGATTIDLIAHSMGNRPLTTALAGMAKSNPHSMARTFKQVILMAPDIDAGLFRQMATSIEIPSDRITLYASSKDVALKLSQAYSGYDRAGEGGANIVVLKGIDTVDASSVDTSTLGFYHQYYADSSTILSDVFHVLNGDPIQDRFGLRSVSTQLGSYWVFVPTAH